MTTKLMVQVFTNLKYMGTLLGSCTLYSMLYVTYCGLLHNVCYFVYQTGDHYVVMLCIHCVLYFAVPTQLSSVCYVDQ